MRQSWRWFGPDDPVPLDHIRQAGASCIVTALHHVPTGEAWSRDEVWQRKREVESQNDTKEPLYWQVVESVNVHDDIKIAAPGRERYIENWCKTLEVLAEAGIDTVCYNFMPLIDWTRTNLSFQLASGAKALLFDAEAFAVFDLFILERPAAEADYTATEIRAAEQAYKAMSAADKKQLLENILAGLPGNTTGSHSLEGFREALKRYQSISAAELRANLIAFLKVVSPVAEELGIRLAIHPDDPPRPLLGLPRVMCTADDVRALFQAIPTKACGLTLCAGTFGVREDNDLVAMANEFAERIYFAHLRGTRRLGNGKSFVEADHLSSDVDMISVIQNLLKEEARRRSAETPYLDIPIRPDHGHQILDDLDKGNLSPGYTAIGRLKGLAEIRGVIATFEHINNETQG